MQNFKISFITFIIILIIAGTSSARSLHANLAKGTPNLVINEFLADPASGLSGDSNGDGVRDSADDEFVEIYNNSGGAVDISNWTLSDSVNVRHTFPAGTVIPADCSIVIFGGDTATGAFGFSLVQIATGGSLGLNNSGDTITLNSGATTVDSVVYGTEGAGNQSLTRDPDVTGVFIQHSDATNSAGSLFSPGTAVDGSNFSGCPIGDLPPTVASTIPDNQVSEVAIDANITINFSEDVTMLAGAFELDCTGDIIALVGTPATADSVILNPVTDMPLDTFCTVTAFAANITDLDDGIDQLDGNGDTTGGDNYSWTFITGLPQLEIWEIQGNSIVSIYADYNVSSSNNIVTALDTDGFYMQTPDIRDDNDVNTSNGVFVYTGGIPTVSVGDQVDVNGPLIEFFELTEFSLPTVTIVSSGNNLPSPILLDDNFPPNDNTPVCATDQTTHKYECLENMWFDMPQGFISAASAGNAFFPGANGDDVIVRAGSHRAFREPGIGYPGDASLPNSPVFDGNPELLEMDIDSLTLPLNKYSAGTELAIKGVFGFDFGEYEIWPSEITIINDHIIPAAVRSATASEATIASANLFRFFDNVDDAGSEDDGTVLTTPEFNDRIAKLSKYIVNDLQAPMILTLQEVENLNSLNQLAKQILTEFSITYTPYLIDGPDPGGINVAYMLRDNVTPSAGFPLQLGTDETQSTNGFILHDRPPLHLQADITLAAGTFQVQILTVHNRSRGKIEDSNPAEAQRVRVKRLEQANSVAAMIDVIQTNNPDDAVITIGDFNAFDFTDGYADVMGQITGTAIELENEHWTAPIFANSPLTQAAHTLPANQQYSYIFGGSAQLLDNAILNDTALTMFNEMQFARGQADANYSYGDDASTSLRVSDHDGFVLFISQDSDLIFNNGFEN